MSSNMFCVTLSDGLQQVAASIVDRLRRRFGSRAGRSTTTRGRRRGSRALRWRRRARRRRWGRRRRRPTTCGHGRWRRRNSSMHRRWRRGSWWGRIGGRWGGKWGRGGRGVETRWRRGDPKATGRRRGGRCRGRGKVGARAGRGRGHGGGRWWVAGTQHADTLLGRTSVLRIVIPAGNRKSDVMMMMVQTVSSCMQVMSMNNHRLNMMSSLCECESVQSRPKSKEANLKIALQLHRTRVQHRLAAAAACLHSVLLVLWGKALLTSCLEVEGAGSHRCQEEVEGSRSRMRRSRCSDRERRSWSPLLIQYCR